MIYQTIEGTLALVNSHNNMALTEEQKKSIISSPEFKRIVNTGGRAGGRTTNESMLERVRRARGEDFGVKETEEVAVVEDPGTGQIGGFFRGAAKGLASTAFGAGKLLSKGVSAVTGADLATSRVERPEALEPKTTAEKVGFTTEQVAEFFIPVPGARAVKAGMGATKAARLGKAGLTGVEVAGRTAIQTGEVGEEAIVAGVATPVLGGVLTKTGEAVFQALPKRLVQKAIGQSKKELLAGKDVSQFALDKKKFGTAKSILADSEKEVVRLSEDIVNRLKTVPVTKSKVSVRKIANDVAGDINAAGGEISTEEVRQIINRLAPQAKSLLSKPTMSIQSANKLRQSIDKTLGDRGFLTSQLPFNKDVLRSFTNTLRNEVKDKAPKGTRELFDELSSEIRLRNSLLENVTKDQVNNSFGLTDFLTFGSVGATGGLIPGVAAVGGKKAVQSTPFLTGAGITLDQLNKAAPILEKLTPAERGVLSQIIQQLLSAEE